jgi:hypothetical protein
VGILTMTDMAIGSFAMGCVISQTSSVNLQASNVIRPAVGRRVTHDV